MPGPASTTPAVLDVGALDPRPGAGIATAPRAVRQVKGAAACAGGGARQAEGTAGRTTVRERADPECTAKAIKRAMRRTPVRERIVRGASERRTGNERDQVPRLQTRPLISAWGAASASTKNSSRNPGSGFTADMAGSTWPICHRGTETTCRHEAPRRCAPVGATARSTGAPRHNIAASWRQPRTSAASARCAHHQRMPSNGFQLVLPFTRSR